MRAFTLPPTIDAILLSNPLNITYLTNFRGVNPSETEGYLLLTKDHWYLLTFSLYKMEAEELQKENPLITPLFITGKHLSDVIKPLLLKHGIRTLGIEYTHLSLAEYDQLKNAFSMTRLIKKDNWIEQLRLYKDSAEIASLKEACQLTDDCFNFIEKQIQLGQKETDIAWEIEKYIKEHNGKLSFEPIVAFNEHSAMPHYIQSDHSQLTANSLVLLDFGASLNGYHADMTRVIFMGKPKTEWLKAYRTVKKAQEEASEYIRSTQTPSGTAADAIAKKIITDAGFPIYSHGLGHGVGLAIHEAPRLAGHRDEILQPNMVFSVEPGIYLPGQFGIRIEDLVLKTKTGIEILSHSPYVS